MFGFSWSEMLIIAIVTLVLVGPQDIPKVIKALSQAFNMAQKMAAEFKAHFSELAHEIDMKEISKHLEMPKLDIEKRIEDTVDPGRQIRDHFSPVPSQESFQKNEGGADQKPAEPPQRPKEIWEEEENLILLENVPALLPPRLALRLADEKKEWVRPSILPPMTAIHDGMRAVIVEEMSATDSKKD